MNKKVLRPMEDLQRVDLQVYVATLYYKEKKSQQEIAELLGYSRPTVSRILQSCIDDGIVTIRILNTSSNQIELASQIKKKYNLENAFVVTSQQDKERTLTLIGQSVADYFSEMVDSDKRMGISAGNAIEHTIPYFHPVWNYRIDVFQMIGDASHTSSSCSSFLTTSIARALGGTAHTMHVPLLVHSKVLRDLLLEEIPNKNHFNELNHLDIALFGLGYIESILGTLNPEIYDIPRERKMLHSFHAVGDICGNYLTLDGSECKTEFSDRTIAIPLENLFKIPTRIAVAIGKEKQDIALAALRGNFITTMFLDEILATSLL